MHPILIPPRARLFVAVVVPEKEVGCVARFFFCRECVGPRLVVEGDHARVAVVKGVVECVSRTGFG